MPPLKLPHEHRAAAIESIILWILLVSALVLRRYSAAIKPIEGKRRPWIRQLRADGKRPEGWPPGADWQRYRADWMATLAHAGDILEGEVPDPLPRAVHYGGWIDRLRPGPHWRRIDAPGLRNYFYRVRRAAGHE
jgi:hypothetical protein